MVCRQMLAVLAVAMVAMATLPAMARATEYVSSGITLEITTSSCQWPRFSGMQQGFSTQEPLASGDDAVPLLSSPGKRWYVCGKAEHCESGHKLVITVLPSLQAPAASPTPPAPVTGSSSKITVLGHQSLMVVFVAVLTTFMT